MITQVVIFTDHDGAMTLADCINSTLSGLHMEPHDEGGMIVKLRFRDDGIKEWVKAGSEAGRKKGRQEILEEITDPILN